MSAPGDNSYLITGKVCPPKLPIQKVSEGWNLTPSLLESLFNEVSVQGRQPNNSHSVCALSFQASIWLSTDGLSSSAVGGLPYFLCNFCDYHTDSKAKLLQHIVCRHVFKCKLCDFVSFSLNELVQHQLHKHLDDEEMQPALNSKIVLMNLSLLQRNSHIFSHSDSISSKSSNGKPAESEIANSSVINISKVCPTGHENHQTQQENEQSEHPSVNNESPVTSSKDKTHHVDATGTVSKPHWNMLNGSNKRESLSKRGHSHGEFSDSELSPKRFRKTCPENFEASDALLDHSQRHSNQMLHFLDGSDSYVTSSCSPHKNASPVLLEMKEEPNGHGRTQSEAEEAYSAEQVLSFFMEPTSSAVSIDLEKLDTRDHENSASQLGPLPKTSSLYDDFYCESLSKQVDIHLSGADQMLPGCSRTDQSVLSKASKKVETLEEESQHSELSVLSREDLKMQPDRETSQRSPGPLQESCTGILEILQQRNHLLQSRNVASHKTSEFSIKTDDLTDKCSKIRWSHSKDVTSGNLDNFLILPGNSAENANLKENESLSVDSRNDTSEHYVKHKLSESDETHLSVREKESYDLLRRLLLGTASSKHLSDNVSTKPEEKQTEIVASKDVSSCYFSQADEDNSGLQSHSPVVTRASDMSLRDLLTQGLGSIHQSLFFQCSYCSFKSVNKADSQKHIKVCKFRFAQNKTKTIEILTKPDCEFAMTNTDNPSIKCKSLDGDYSSEKFVASELLKGISEHYCESLSGDVSLYDKSHELNGENQLYACDKSHTLQHENQASVHDKSCASKSLDQVYSCDKSSTLKSDGHIYSSDKSHTLKSDIEMNSISNMLKNDARVSGCHLGDHADGRARRHTSSDIEISASKNVIHKSGQNLEPAWNYYSEAFEGLGNYVSGEKPDESHVKMEEVSRSRIPLNKKHDLNIGEEFLFRDQNLSSERQHKSRYTCTYCDFSTNNVTYVRQHLFESHPTNASFVEAVIPQKGKTSLYLCKGTKSTCAFVSSENAEIFQHIKICYCGYLDNFIHTDNRISPDYSHILFCLGQASGFINTSAETFHCLRCSYYAPEFQQVAGHISDNHAGLVAGVLSVNNSFIEPRIRMVCLLCKAHISVKHWAFHHCRKRSESDFSRQDAVDLDSRDHCATRLEAILRQSSLTRQQPLSYGSNSSLDSLSLVSDTGMTVFSDQENCRSQVKINRQSLSSNEPGNQIHVNNRPSSLRKSFNENTLTEAVDIKQEIPDVALPEVQNDDVMVHFKQERLVETDDDGTVLMPFRDIQSSSQKARTTSSPQTCSRKLTSASSVLHSLLTSRGSIELSQQGFSSLHKLLQSDLATEDKRPSKEIPVLQADFMSAADLHSQYPCILEILKRQETASQETTQADTASLSSTDDVVQQEESRDLVTRQPNSVLLNALCSPHVLSQQIHNASTTCLPKLHLLLPGEESEKGTRRVKSSASTAESQDMTGPFTNLLQLLCKSKKSDP